MDYGALANILGGRIATSGNKTMARERHERALRKGGTWKHKSGFKNQGTLLTVCTVAGEEP